MNQARSRAIDRLRFEQGKKRTEPERDSALLTIDLPDYRDALEFKEQSRALSKALGVLTPGEREAIEAAFFSELTHAEVASRLDQPPGTITARIRSGLHKLRQALDKASRKL